MFQQCRFEVHEEIGRSTGVRRLMRGLATLTRGAAIQEPVVVTDGDGRPQEDQLVV